MVNLLEIYEAEKGEPIAITIRNPEGKSIDISWAVTADSKIEVKNDDDTVVLTLTSTDFAITSPDVIWTPTATHLSALTKGVVYECFVHLTKTSTSRVKLARFLLKKLDN